MSSSVMVSPVDSSITFSSSRSMYPSAFLGGESREERAESREERGERREERAESREQRGERREERGERREEEKKLGHHGPRQPEFLELPEAEHPLLGERRERAESREQRGERREESGERREERGEWRMQP